MTKKQHYVPQFYLRNFTSDDNKLWVFDREKKEYYHSAPKDICFEKFLYETPWEDANPKLGKYVLENQIEDYFAEKEREYSFLLKKIIGICREPRNKNALICNAQEKEVLASFIANMFLRNPWLLKHIDSDTLLEELKGNEEIEAIEQALHLMKFGGMESLVKAANKKVWLTGEFNGARLAPDIQKLNYVILVTENEQFVTSSFPVICELYDNEEGITMPKSIYAPIHPRVSLLYNDTIPNNHRNRIRVVNEDTSYRLNRIYLRRCKEQIKFIMSKDKQLLKSVVEKDR